MSVEEQLTLKLFNDLRTEGNRFGDFDKAVCKLATMMKGVPWEAISATYNLYVVRGDLLPIELISLQEKNGLKEMAKKYCNTVEYCKSLHLFINFMQKETV
jgi:hypothetical protein